MTEEIDQTIEDFEGLSADRYDEIIRAAQADTELKEKSLRCSRRCERSEEIRVANFISPPIDLEGDDRMAGETATGKIRSWDVFEVRWHRNTQRTGLIT